MNGNGKETLRKRIRRVPIGVNPNDRVRNKDGVLSELKCSTCKEWKLPVEFPKSSASWTGFGYTCKACKRAASKKRWDAIREGTHVPRGRHRTESVRQQREEAAAKEPSGVASSVPSGAYSQTTIDEIALKALDSGLNTVLEELREYVHNRIMSVLDGLKD